MRSDARQARSLPNIHYVSLADVASLSIAKKKKIAQRRKQCDQIHKLGQECKPNGENLYILPSFKLHQHDCFVTFKSRPSNRSIYFKRVFEKKTSTKNWHYPPFLLNDHKTCSSRIEMISDSWSPSMAAKLALPIIAYLRISISIFPIFYTPKMKLFSYILCRN